jgi:hypothetical protein
MSERITHSFISEEFGGSLKQKNGPVIRLARDRVDFPAVNPVPVLDRTEEY